MFNLKQLLQSKIVKQKKGRGVSNFWQEKAFREAEELKIDLTCEPTIKGRWLKTYKEGHHHYCLRKAYSYLKDYPYKLESINKIKLFFKIYGNCKKQGR